MALEQSALPVVPVVEVAVERVPLEDPRVVRLAVVPTEELERPVVAREEEEEREDVVARDEDVPRVAEEEELEVGPVVVARLELDDSKTQKPLRHAKDPQHGARSPHIMPAEMQDPVLPELPAVVVPREDPPNPELVAREETVAVGPLEVNPLEPAPTAAPEDPLWVEVPPDEARAPVEPPCETPLEAELEEFEEALGPVWGLVN